MNEVLIFFKSFFGNQHILFSKFFIGQTTFEIVMFWTFDPAKNAIQGDAPEGSDTF